MAECDVLGEGTTGIEDVAVEQRTGVDVVAPEEPM